ncbi:DUF4270 domain-containing protein [Aquimarina sp. 2201CG14-23]|uniref:DUF4270 domain-containing protein n=1 Tax=Aquimarina mycalae TaxID=3040073 RepID=UPI002477D10E|nr:DUF4270 domain-containing protein [Aquimarina sp. 2201CG14-23]MDH7446130.1 DUF4270 domain-containing protein [Aquimarina sp. 2201CG14-23]
MKLKNVMIKITAIVAVVFTVASCDDDFNSVGSEVIGDVNFEDDEYTAVPVAYSKRFERVQSSNLPNNLLGIYNDPVYGQTTYNVLSQVLLSRQNPVFGENAVLDSVVLNLPYFSSVTESEVNDDGDVVNTYELDSVYGIAPMNLSIYQSNYFLRDFDLGSGAEDRQLYYSNDISDNFGMSVEGTLLKEIEFFLPSENEVVLTTPDGADEDTDPDKTRFSPRLRISLKKADALGTNDQPIIDHFTSLFLDKEGSVELSNANNFRNYFRGVYFKTQPVTGNGSLVFFNIADADITLFYTFDKVDTLDEDDDDDTTDFIEDNGELELSFSNNIVNGIENNFNTTILDELANQDEVNGEENLYLKGGEGAYAVVDLFNGNIINENGEEENELDFLIRQDWLIKDASLKFYINQDLVTNEVVNPGRRSSEPERVFLFNLETGEVLIDYIADGTGNNTVPILSVIDHLGRITRDSDENGEFYRIRLTQHIINVLNGDIDNVKLGLSVSQNVNIVANAAGFTPTNTEDEIIPFSSIISHEGTILYGNGTNVPDDKRLKLDIFYTKAKSN